MINHRPAVPPSLGGDRALKAVPVSGIWPHNAGMNTATTRSPAELQRHFRTPLGRRLASLFSVSLLAFVSVLMVGFAVAGFTLNWGLGLFMSAIAGFMVALVIYVGRDFGGNWGLRVGLDDDAVRLNLPSGRSLIHRPPARRLSIPYTDIAAIDTRLEYYGSLRMGLVQRAYALRRKSGELIFLFEERGLATPFASAQFKGIVAGLTTLAGVELHDLGMVEGSGGFLAAWGAHAPDWATPPVSAERQQQLWRRAAATGGFAIVASSAATSAWYGGLLVRPKRGEQPPPSPRS